MKRLLIARLVMTFVGVVIFGLGVRSNSAALRWTGIAIVGASLLLRFLPGPRDP